MDILVDLAKTNAKTKFEEKCLKLSNKFRDRGKRTTNNSTITDNPTRKKQHYIRKIIIRILNAKY